MANWRGWFRYVSRPIVCTSRRCFCVWISDEAAVGLNQDMSEGPSSSSLAVIISIWGWRRDRGLKEKRAAGLDDILRFLFDCVTQNTQPCDELIGNLQREKNEPLLAVRCWQVSSIHHIGPVCGDGWMDGKLCWAMNFPTTDWSSSPPPTKMKLLPVQRWAHALSLWANTQQQWP